MKILLICITGYLLIGLIASIILSLFGMIDMNIALLLFVVCIGMILVNREVFKNDRARKNDEKKNE